MRIPSRFLGQYAAEITFFLFKIAESMLEPTARLFIYDGVCLNLYPPGYHDDSQTIQSKDDTTQPTNNSRPSPALSAGGLTSPVSDACVNLKMNPHHELAVQNEAAQYMMYYKIILNLPAMILVLFCGALSDRTGRKLPIMLTCFGTTMATVLYMISIHIGPQLGVPYLPLFLIGAGLRGAFGRSAVMTMAVHSYVSDHSSPEKRTQKISSLVAMSHFGYLIGSSCAGLMLDHFGYIWVFLTVASTQATCALTAVACMEEEDEICSEAESSLSSGSDQRTELAGSTDVIIIPDTLDVSSVRSRHGSFRSDDGERAPLLNDKRQTGNNFNAATSRTVVVGPHSSSVVEPTGGRRNSQSGTSLKADQLLEEAEDEEDQRKQVEEDGDEGSADERSSDKTEDQMPLMKNEREQRSEVGFFGLFVESFTVLFRPREGSLRCQLIILFLSIYVQQMMKSGEIDILLLYVERTPINMSKSSYGYFLAVNYLGLGVCAFIGPLLLERLLGLSDGAIAVTGLIARMIGLVVLCLSDSAWMVFLAAVIGGPHSLTVSSCKSMVSKLIGEGDMGKTFSLLSSGETLANLLGTAVFANLYSATLSIYAGSAFVFESGVFVLLTVVIGYVGWLQCCYYSSLSAEGGRQRKSSRVYTSP